MDTYPPEQFQNDCIDLTLPYLLDEIAQRTPDRVFVSLPVDDDVSHGFRDYTYQDFSRAIDNCAWWMHGVIGSGVECQTVAYVGPQDLRYAIMIIAALKAGHKVISAKRPISCIV